MFTILRRIFTLRQIEYELRKVFRFECVVFTRRIYLIQKFKFLWILIDENLRKKYFF